jgi:DNA-binding CsgD family transcriptional regulator
MPQDWVRDYTEQNLASMDPVCERLRRCHSPFAWELSDLPAPRTGGGWQEFLLSHDIHSGFVVPDYSQGDLSLISLAGKPPDRHDRALLHFAGLALLARCRELGVRHGAEMPPLSERERECLQWVAAGKSDWQIGEILSLSEKTINIYIERAKQKLGVHTRTQAIVRAMRAGIVDM